MLYEHLILSTLGKGQQAEMILKPCYCILRYISTFKNDVILMYAHKIKCIMHPFQFNPQPQLSISNYLIGHQVKMILKPRYCICTTLMQYSVSQDEIHNASFQLQTSTINSKLMSLSRVNYMQTRDDENPHHGSIHF